MTQNEFINKAIELFLEYREDFGLCQDCDDAPQDIKDSWFNKHGTPYPSEKHSDRQCEFEDKFAELICELKGHNLVPDHCLKPEHDLCTICNKRREDLTE